MKKETEIFLSTLKELYNNDPNAIDFLISMRIPFNGDTDIYVREVFLQENKSIRVGILGILNGILEKINGDKISAIVNENDTLVGFDAIEAISKDNQDNLT